MFRPSPRLVAALLWLSVALMPLRALGMVWMQAAPAVAAAATAAMPCHGDASSAATASEPTAHHACQLCDLCHAGVTVAPDAPAVAPAPAVQAPGGAPVASHGRVAPDGLFRPPR